MKISLESIFAKKKKGQKITVLTSYDFPTARILDDCGIDIQLVGDSLGTNLLGYKDVTEVTVSDMLHHLKAVARGIKKSFILCDMPYKSFSSKKQAYKNSSLLIDGGADGIKIESEKPAIDKISYLTSKGIPVCAHIGYTPQTPGLTASVQGKDMKKAEELVNLALESEKAGAFMIVLELIPEKLSKIITETLSIPTIGIGAGRYCDGQVLVILDMLGMSEKVFRHVKKYSNLSETYRDAIKTYINDVQNGYFPTEKNVSSVPDEVISFITNKLFPEQAKK